METVINVPESVLDIIYKDKTLNDEQLAILHRCIRNGTVLPKGHGALIDVYDLAGKIHGVKSIAAVLEAPVIIPADTESGGEE